MTGPVQPRMPRPRLSLQTKPTTHGPGIRTRNYFNSSDPKSPTAFNTLSNIYVTAIERSTPIAQSTPLTAIRLQQPLESDASRQQAGQTPTAAAPGSPLTANVISSPQKMDVVFPSTMTPTPPLSAGSVDPGRKIFTFNASDVKNHSVPSSPTATIAQSRCRISYTSHGSDIRAPYSHNRALHSILRNSPLQQTTRTQEKVERRVGYDSPLTQTITTEKYTKSHIDLLTEDASPYTPSPVLEDSDMMLDLTPTCSGEDETTRDGGQTPGPFEDMRRRMTNLATKTSVIPSPRLDGIRKRKRKEKKRKWVWTIGKEDDENESGAMAALRAAADELSTPKASRATVPEVKTPDTPVANRMCVDPVDGELASTT